MKHYIKIGDIEAENELGKVVYQNRCLADEFIYADGDITTDDRPWADGEMPYDYKYENGEFVHDPLTLSEPEPTEPETTVEDLVEALNILTEIVLGGNAE